MKKLFIFILIFIIILIIIFNHKQYGHSINYVIKSDSQEFKIKEVLVKEEGYYLYVTQHNNKYIFHYDDTHNNKKKILTNIKYYKNGNIECLYPIYHNDDSNNNILCNKDKKLYSYTSIRQTNKNINIFENLNLELFKNSEISKTYHRLSIYHNNIPSNNYIVVWNYKGVDIVTKGNPVTVNYLDQDKYDNTHGFMINNLYITPDYNEKYDFSKYIVIDVKTNKKREYKLDNKVSYDSYINGIIDDKLYLFDRDNLIEYEFDILHNKQKIIGNKELNGKYFDGTWKDINIYNLLNDKLYFKKEIKLDEDYQSVIESSNSYYLYYKNGDMYQIYKNDLQKKILLFNKKNIKDLKVSDDYVYFRDKNNIYVYHDNYGLRKVLENSEFTYNSHNIFEVYYKK